MTKGAGILAIGLVMLWSQKSQLQRSVSNAKSTHLANASLGRGRGGP